jgi:two-component system chemotaxis sensor kinase CheA
MISESPIIQKMLDQSIYKDISQLGKIIKDMQRQVLSLRMIPIKPTFQRMTRLVRDLSKQANKKVELQLSGEDTELDKTVIEEIGDPLVHLIRNSIDHGLESEEERIAGGKPPVGTILLNAYHQGGNIVIEVVDDGRGLNKEKIIKKAKEKGLISSESNLTVGEIYNLIFLPGFSTTEKVTAVSGRGVGMDVVRMNIEKLKGQVELSTEEGKWTKTTIKLPLTLAIIDGMLVRIDKDKFIIPTLSIIESIRPKKKDIYTVEGRGEIVNVRGKILPLVRLNRIFGLKSEKQEPWEGLVVVVESEGNRCCLFVDDLIGQQRVVIKSLGERLRNVKGIAGSAILGDGTVGLILDVAGIMELVFNKTELEEQLSSLSNARTGKMPVLSLDKEKKIIWRQ